MPSAIYVRISSDPLSQRAGVERQLADCETIIRQRGWPAPVKYEDNDVSAWNGKRRPAFEQMLLDLGGLDAVVAWDLDRLFRQPRDLERFLDRCEKVGMHKVTTAQGDIDLTSADGRLRARIMAAVGAKESDDKSRRIKRALKDRAEQGVWHGNRAPFGYTVVHGQLTPNNDARHVREAYISIKFGGSIRALARGPHGPTTQQGWRKLLLSPTMAGCTSAGVRGNWEPIVSVEMWAEVKSILEAPERTKHRGTERTHWLKGILVCGKCGADMIHQRRARNGVDYSRWTCSKCRGCTIVAGPVEEYLEAAVLEAAPLTPVPGTYPPEGGDGVPLGILQQQLDQLNLDYSSRLIERSEWLLMRDNIRSQMKPVHAPPPTPVPSAQEWAVWSPGARHRAAAGLLGRVVVLPGRTDALGDRLSIEWVQ